MTDGVYDLFYTTNLILPHGWTWRLRCDPGQTNLAMTGLTDLQGFFIAGLTNDTDGDGMSDAFEKLVSGTDPNNGDENSNGIPDGWEWKYFATLALPSDADYDGDGWTILQEYQQGVDPNKIRFSIEVTNNYVSTNLAPMQWAVAGGVPSFVAALVDGANFAGANWTAYDSSNITVNFGAAEGWHEIWIGLKGLPPEARQAWQRKRMKLDLTPPQLVVTSPTNNIVMQPMIQLQGYSPEALATISYDLTNAAGLATNRQVLVLDQFYDTNTWEFTTNTFQAFDIALTNGVNTITLYATDLAGNTTTTNFSFTLDYSSKTNPPVIWLYWPQDGARIAGSNFTWRGWVDDPTATVTASIIDTNGDTNTFNGLMERDGNFWLENLPLNAGTNRLTLTVADAAGNVSTTNITVVQSTLVLTMNPVYGDPLWNPALNVNGTISDPTYAVWVNGVQGINNGNGTWSADNVPTIPGGTASFNMTAYPPGEAPSGNPGGGGSGGSGPGGGGSGGSGGGAGGGNASSPNSVDVNWNTDKPAKVFVTSDIQNRTYHLDERVDYDDGSWGEEWDDSHHDQHWSDGEGGGSWLESKMIADSDSNGTLTNEYCAGEFNWSATSGMTVTEDTCAPKPVPYVLPASPCFGMEHCAVNDSSNYTYCPCPGTIVSVDESYNRNAQTRMKLFTGGKGVAGRQNLFVIHAAATKILDKYAFPACTMYSTWPGVPMQAIPPQDIKIMGQNLDSDGNLYVTLPDDDVVDITPQVDGVDFYTFFDLQVSKYKSYFEVFVDMPYPPDSGLSLPGDGDWYYLFLNSKFGHVWWMLNTEVPADAMNKFKSSTSNFVHFMNLPFGYGNTNGIALTGPGRVFDPDGGSVTVKARYEIGFQELLSGLQHMYYLEQSPPYFDWFANNCVIQTIYEGQAVGVQLPYKHTPQYFGKALYYSPNNVDP